MKSIWEYTDKLSHIATMATAAVAVVALVVAVYQIRAANTSQRETAAKEAYKEYLKLAIEHPDIADGKPLLGDNSQSARARYEWFVMYLLYSAEQIFNFFPNDKAWHRALADQLCYHLTYLTEPQVRSRLERYYDPPFKQFINEVINSQNCPPRSE